MRIILYIRFIKALTGFGLFNYLPNYPYKNCWLDNRNERLLPGAFIVL